MFNQGLSISGNRDIGHLPSIPQRRDMARAGEKKTKMMKKHVKVCLSIMAVVCSAVVLVLLGRSSLKLRQE